MSDLEIIIRGTAKIICNLWPVALAIAGVVLYGIIKERTKKR